MRIFYIYFMRCCRIVICGKAVIAKLWSGYYRCIQFTSMHYVSSRLMGFPSNCANCEADPSLCFLYDYNVLVADDVVISRCCFMRKQETWLSNMHKSNMHKSNMHLSNQLANHKRFVFPNYGNYTLWKYSLTSEYLREIIKNYQKITLKFFVFILHILLTNNSENKKIVIRNDM